MTISELEDKIDTLGIRKIFTFTGVHTMIFGKKESDDVGDLKARIAALEKQNNIMREALEFYSNPITWESGHKYRDVDNATIFTDGSESSATVDKGAHAYRALEACASTD
jgi:hypothetical protein